MPYRLQSAALAVAATIMLAACDVPDSNGSVSISMNSEGDAGNVSIDVPGFKAKVNVPASVMGQGNFDIDGVKLYPGSKVTSFHVDASTDDAKGKNNAVVKMGYDAPADAAKVKGWYLNAFKEKSVKAVETASGVAGTTKDGNEFTMTFAPADAGHTAGTIMLTDRDSH